MTQVKRYMLSIVALIVLVSGLILGTYAQGGPPDPASVPQSIIDDLSLSQDQVINITPAYSSLQQTLIDQYQLINEIGEQEFELATGADRHSKSCEIGDLANKQKDAFEYIKKKTVDTNNGYRQFLNNTQMAILSRYQDSLNKSNVIYDMINGGFLLYPDFAPQPSGMKPRAIKLLDGGPGGPSNGGLPQEIIDLLDLNKKQTDKVVQINNLFFGFQNVSFQTAYEVSVEFFQILSSPDRHSRNCQLGDLVNQVQDIYKNIDDQAVTTHGDILKLLNAQQAKIVRGFQKYFDRQEQTYILASFNFLVYNKSKVSNEPQVQKAAQIRPLIAKMLHLEPLAKYPITTSK